MNYVWQISLLVALLIIAVLLFYIQALYRRIDDVTDTLEKTLKAYSEVLCSRHLPSATDSMIILQELDMIERLGLGDEQKGNA